MRYFFAFLASVLATAPAFAAVPVPGGINLQPPATRIMERLHDFHNYLLIIITLVTIFVAVLLLWVCFAYSKKRNPVPRKFSHNTTIEVIWTVVPVLILVAIAGPSFSNLFYQENEPDLVAIAESGNVDDPNVNVEAAEQGWITVKAIGMGNWAWTYEYPDVTDDAGYPLSFVSNGIHLGLPTDPPATPERPLYLAADYPMVIPVNRYIRYQTASDRVIHSWTVPSFGVKTDAIPGRLNEGWFLVRETGVYYGQCSELCGKNHAFMPIEVRVVTQEQYDRWIEVMKTGDIDAATQMVQNTEPAGEQTQLASMDLN